MAGGGIFPTGLYPTGLFPKGIFPKITEPPQPGTIIDFDFPLTATISPKIYTVEVSVDQKTASVLNILVKTAEVDSKNYSVTQQPKNDYTLVVDQ
jgi:hypothetical protein